MKNYKMTVRYDGTRYRGWQRLGRNEDTIQGKLENVLSRFMDKKMEITGGGRTDRGAHAHEHVAGFKTEAPINVYELRDYFARYLPEDIAVIEVMEADPDFHARFDITKKTYVYKIWNKNYPEPFLRRYSMHVKKKLDLEKMRAAAGYLVGKHDFTAFTTSRSSSKSKVRTIYGIDVENMDGLVVIRISGNGFLHNMVRKIAGILIMTGLNEIKPGEVHRILISKEREKVELLADACGLHLEKTEY